MSPRSRRVPATFALLALVALVVFLAQSTGALAALDDDPCLDKCCGEKDGQCGTHCAFCSCCSHAAPGLPAGERVAALVSVARASAPRLAPPRPAPRGRKIPHVPRLLAC